MTVIFDPKSKACHAAEKRNGFLCFLGLDELLPLVFTPQACRFNQPRIYRAGLRCHSVHHQKSACQSGFTLLEMLVVIGLLGVLMLTATTYIVDTGEIEQQNRQEENIRRWGQVRTAIIGDINSHFNQQPMVNSYVADMGRLPAGIDELVARGAQPEWAQFDISTLNPKLSPNTAYLWGGWHGPYLYTAGSRFFRDAWRNESAVDDAINHGWVVTHTPVTVPACTTVPDCTDISVQSLGDDGVAGGAEFNEDYPLNPQNIVNSNEWQISAANIGFNVVLNKAPTAADQANLDLRIYFIDDGVLAEEVSSEFSHLLAEVSASTHFVTISSAAPPVRLPMGKYAAVIMCNKGTASTLDDVLYSGNCSAPAATPPTPYYFTLLANTPLPITIPWNIP